jgi:hypothetical protein
MSSTARLPEISFADQFVGDVAKLGVGVRGRSEQEGEGAFLVKVVAFRRALPTIRFRADRGPSQQPADGQRLGQP